MIGSSLLYVHKCTSVFINLTISHVRKKENRVINDDIEFDKFEPDGQVIHNYRPQTPNRHHMLFQHKLHRRFKLTIANSRTKTKNCTQRIQKTNCGASDKPKTDDGLCGYHQSRTTAHGIY